MANGPYYNNQQVPPNWNGGQNSYIGSYQNQNQMMQQQITPQFNPMGQTQEAQISKSVLPGRVINSIDDVQPQEVPMDGSWTFFPTASGNDIYAMTWNREGRIDKLRYVRDQNAQSSNGGDSVLSQIMSKLDDVNHQLYELKQQYRYQPKKHKPNTNNHPKVEKEVNDNA